LSHSRREEKKGIDLEKKKGEKKGGENTNLNPGSGGKREEGGRPCAMIIQTGSRYGGKEGKKKIRPKRKGKETTSSLTERKEKKISTCLQRKRRERGRLIGKEDPLFRVEKRREEAYPEPPRGGKKSRTKYFISKRKETIAN